MQNTGEKMIRLIGSEVCGNTLSLRSPLTAEEVTKIYSLAHIHDMAHIVCSALLNMDMLADNPGENFYREKVYSTLYRYESQSYVLEKISSVLENEKIPYVPLKGAVIKEFYPQPWMRTGCDIDILVHEEDLRRATDAITEFLGYEEKGRGKHDIQILSTENIFVELHFSLLEEDASPSMAKVLNTVWEHAKPVESGKYKYELDDAMFYFYHIAHMAKHFVGGGCGIRPFLDLWLMEKNRNYDTAETEILLKNGKLADFANAARKLSKVWFSGEEHDRVTKLMEDFVFNGGCFGSRETKMLSEQQKSGGRMKYILSRIFVPYDELKGQYPIIKKYKFLTPVCEICRIFTLIFGKRKGFRKDFVKDLKGFSEEKLEGIDYLFYKTGLK